MGTAVHEKIDSAHAIPLHQERRAVPTFASKLAGPPSSYRLPSRASLLMSVDSIP
jgi:hypothetical protein